MHKRGNLVGGGGSNMWVVYTRQGLKVISCLWCIDHSIVLGFSQFLFSQNDKGRELLS